MGLLFFGFIMGSIFVSVLWHNFINAIGPNDTGNVTKNNQSSSRYVERAADDVWQII
jgi:hypothetical protein